MITFSPDHSAAVGHGGLQRLGDRERDHLLRLGLARVPGRRSAGRSCCSASSRRSPAWWAGSRSWRTTALFFSVVIVWAVLAGVIETAAGIRQRRSALRSQDDPQRAVRGARRAHHRHPSRSSSASRCSSCRPQYALELLHPGRRTVLHPHRHHHRRRASSARYAAIVAVYLGDRGLLAAPACPPTSRDVRRGRGIRSGESVMTDDKPTRRDLMKPVQLLGLAFGAAAVHGDRDARDDGLLPAAHRRQSCSSRRGRGRSPPASRSSRCC